jgi:hypothetical protein
MDFFFGPAVNDLRSRRTAVFPFVGAKLWRDFLGLKVQVGLEQDSFPLAGVKNLDSSISTVITLQAGE